MRVVSVSKFCKLYIEQLTCTHRWGALLHGKHRTIPLKTIISPEKYVDTVLLNFRPLSMEERLAEPNFEDNVKQGINKLMSHVEFAFFSGYTNPNNGLVISDTVSGAITEIPLDPKIATRIFLSIELVQPLLRKDLTDAGRYAYSVCPIGDFMAG